MINSSENGFRTSSSALLIDVSARSRSAQTVFNAGSPSTQIALDHATIGALGQISFSAMRRKYKQSKSNPARSRSIRSVLSTVILCWTAVPCGTAALPAVPNSLAFEPALAESRSCLGANSRTDRALMRCQVADEILERTSPQFAFKERPDSPALVFCRVRTSESDHHPAILIHDEGGWRCLEMSSEVYEQSEWVYAGTSRDKKLIWAVSDWDVEGPGWDLELTFSSDAGRSWRHLGSIQKQSYLSLLDSLQMETLERGWLSVYLDDDYYRGAPRGQRLAKGYYIYHTSDGWRHWSNPRYSRRRPRVLRRARLLRPSYTAPLCCGGGINEIKDLMARMQATPKN